MADRKPKKKNLNKLPQRKKKETIVELVESVTDLKSAGGQLGRYN